MRLDQVIALPLIGPTELGYYAAAVGLAESTMILASAGRTLMMGRSAGTRGSDARQAPLIKLILSLTGTGTAILIVASPWIIPLLLGPQFRPAVVPCIIVASGNLALAGCLLASAKILMQNRAWIQSLAYASGAACNVVGLYMFAHLGAAGAALASGLNYSVALGIMLGLLHIRARRCRRLREQEVMT
jgi:O-antigen/teichoic acid export membrane protein